MKFALQTAVVPRQASVQIRHMNVQIFCNKKPLKLNCTHLHDALKPANRRLVLLINHHDHQHFEHLRKERASFVQSQDASDAQHAQSSTQYVAKCVIRWRRHVPFSSCLEVQGKKTFSFLLPRCTAATVRSARPLLSEAAQWKQRWQPPAALEVLDKFCVDFETAERGVGNRKLSHWSYTAKYSRTLDHFVSHQDADPLCKLKNPNYRPSFEFANGSVVTATAQGTICQQPQWHICCWSCVMAFKCASVRTGQRCFLSGSGRAFVHPTMVRWKSLRFFISCDDWYWFTLYPPGFYRGPHPTQCKTWKAGFQVSAFSCVQKLGKLAGPF